MPLYETEAVALRAYDLGEADKIIVFYTSKYGKVRAVAQGARRLKSRFGSSFEPLTHLRLVFYEREGAELAKISQCEIINSPYRAEQEILGTLRCVYFAELVFEFCADRDANETIFRLLMAILSSINAKDDADYIARYFETWLIKLEGLLPKYDICSKCGSAIRHESIRFYPESLHVICQRCRNSGGVFISADVKNLIAKIIGNHPCEFAKLSFDQKSLDDLEQINQKLITYHLGKGIKSYSTIKQLKI